MQSRETQITMVKLTNAGGQTKRANERSFVYRPPAWRRWRNVKTTYSSLFVKPFENGRVGNSNCCHNFYHCPVSNYIYIVATNKPLPSSKNPHFQMRLGAQPFLWKWVLFAWEWKMISISKAEHLPSFWNRGPGELGNGLITAAVDFGEKMRYFLLRHNFSEITT